MALASLAALGLAIFLGFVKKMNTGLLCTALALLVGRLAGISDDEIIRGFNYSLFLMLLGVTYLFGLAEINGTLALLSKKIVALSGRRTYLVPIVMYLFATILSALGPGTIPTAAIMMVFGMTLAKEMNINPAMLAAIIFLGAAGGGMSPLAATGIIGLNLCGEFGLTGIGCSPTSYFIWQIHLHLRGSRSSHWQASRAWWSLSCSFISMWDLPASASLPSCRF